MCRHSTVLVVKRPNPESSVFTCGFPAGEVCLQCSKDYKLAVQVEGNPICKLAGKAARD